MTYISLATFGQVSDIHKNPGDSLEPNNPNNDYPVGNDKKIDNQRLKEIKRLINEQDNFKHYDKIKDNGNKKNDHVKKE